MANAFAFEFDGVSFPAAQTKIPMIADYALKNFFVEGGDGGIEKLSGRVDPVSIEPAFVADVDATDVEEVHGFVGLR